LHLPVLINYNKDTVKIYTQNAPMLGVEVNPMQT